MNFLDQIQRRFGRLAIPNLTLLLVISQALCYVLAELRPSFIQSLTLEPYRVLRGEWWRLITFMIMPPHTNLIFVFFALYVFHFMGTSLEEEWGIFRYNVYLLVAAVATILAAFIGRIPLAGNFFIETSVFLAFAYLYPEIEFLMFLIVPVKVKYLAFLTWLFYGYIFLAGSDSERLLMLASICNFLLFFGADIRQRWRTDARRAHFEAERRQAAQQTVHRCQTCAATEQSAPEIQFRVCSRCSAGQEYCLDHIRDHQHV